MSDQLNVCVVGSGDMGQKHIRGWQALNGVKLFSLVDVDEQRANEVAEKFGIPHVFSDWMEAIAQPDIDVVSVCVPTCFHPEVTVFAAERGKHVLCEKPIGLSLDSVQNMIEVVEKAGVKLGIGFMRRASPVTAKLRQFLDAEREPVIYRAETALEIRPKRAMHDQQLNGGPLIDMLCHFIDTARAIFQSEPVRVSGHGLTFAQHRPEIDHIANKAVDSGSFSVEFESGDICCGFITWGLPPGIVPTSRLRESIFGPHGELEVHFTGSQKIVWHKEGGSQETLLASDANNYHLEIEAFARALLDDGPILAKGVDGLKALEVSVALLESIRTGCEVVL